MKWPAVGLALAFAILGRPGLAIADDALEQCVDAAERGQALKRAGRLIDARGELLKCADRECPSVVRGDCARWADEIQAAMPSIVVRASVGARDVTEVRLFVDGAPVADRLDGKPRFVDPGEHVVRARAPRGEWTATVKVLLASGEQHRVITLAFEDPASARGEEVRRPSTLSWILGGLGATAGVGAGIAYGLGVSERAHLVDTCAGPRTCSNDSIDGARTKLIVGDVLLGAGLVALTSSVVLYFVAPHRELRSVKTAQAWSP